MYIYNVTVKVENRRVDEWIEWMKSKHIPDVLATGYFLESRICRLLDDIDPDGETFTIQYTCNSREDYLQYKLTNAPHLQKEVKDKFADDFIAFRTFMEIL